MGNEGVCDNDDNDIYGDGSTSSYVSADCVSLMLLHGAPASRDCFFSLHFVKKRMFFYHSSFFIFACVFMELHPFAPPFVVFDLVFVVAFKLYFFKFKNTNHDAVKLKQG